MSARLWFPVLFLLTAVPLVAPAQEVTGRLAGRVVSTEAMGLADVEITATSPGLIGTRRTSTDRGGWFQLPALPIGTYRVLVRRVGFRPVVVAGVPVRLGETASLPRVTLESEGAIALAELVVTPEAAGLDPVSTANRATFDIGRLEALPLSRNFRDITLLAPQAVPSFLGDGINVAGATGFENTYYVDGINITSPINGSTSIDLPYNFIQQIEVRTGGSTADDPQALGGVVNLVTPSGGNEFHGSVTGFWSGDALQSSARSVTGATQTGFAFYDAAISLSGPVLRDRLWFFAAYDRNYERRDQTYVFGTLPDIRRQDLFAGKLTWRVGPRTSATFPVLGDPSQLELVSLPPFSGGVPQSPEVLSGTGKAGGVGLSVRAQHAVSRTVLIEASASQMTRLERAEAATAAGRAPSVTDAVDGTIYGGHGFGYRYDSGSRSFRVDVTWSPSVHTVRVGASYNASHNTMTACGGRNTCGGDITRSDASDWSWHFYDSGPGRGVTHEPAAYIQDAWRVTPNVLVTGGVRWSRQDMINGNVDTLAFRIQDGLQPRFGVVWQPDRLRAQRVFASWARVADPLPLYSAQQFAFGAETLMTYSHDPRSDPTGGTIIYGMPYGDGWPSDQDIRGQTFDEWTLGYGRRLEPGSVLSVRLVRRALRDVVANGTDTNGAWVWGNPARGSLARFPRARRTYDALEVVFEHTESGSTWYQLSYALSRTRGNYPGTFLSDWHFHDGTADCGPLYGFPSQWVNADGLLPNDRTHVFKALGSHRLRFGLALGASLLVSSGTPRTEFGAIAEASSPFFGYASTRGSAGRTPTIWDLGIRATYEIPVARRGSSRPRIVLDLQHVGSPRTAVAYNPVRYTCLDANGDQSCPNAAYGKVTQYQPPMAARLGVVLDF